MNRRPWSPLIPGAADALCTVSQKLSWLVNRRLGPERTLIWTGENYAILPTRAKARRIPFRPATERCPMIPVWDAPTSFRFSTEGLSDTARAKAVRELYERVTVAGKIEPLEPLPDCPVRVDIIKLALRGLDIISGVLCGLRQAVRPIGSVSSGEDNLLIAINLSGCSIAQQRDRELMLQQGDAVVATRGLTGFTITRPTPVNLVGFRVPRQEIAPLVGRLDDAQIRVVSHGTTALNLLVTYAHTLINDHPATPELQRLVVTHFHDLIAAVVGAT